MMTYDEINNQACLRNVHLYADDVLTISGYSHNVSYWSATGVTEVDTKTATPVAHPETSCPPREIEDVSEQLVCDHIPAFVEICDVSLPSASSGQNVFQPYLRINSPILCPRMQCLDANECLLKECSTASTAPISKDPMSTSSEEAADFFILRECSGTSCQTSSVRTTFSEISRCSTSPSSSSASQGADLLKTTTLSRGDDENSIYSDDSSSSSEDSSSTSTALSGESYSTLLESDDSSESSLFSDDSFSRYERTVSSNHSPRSTKLRKSFERRDRELRRLSLGNKGYRIYLSRQEELVQQHAYTRSYPDPKTFNLKDALACHHVEEACAITERKHSITYNVQRRFLFERYHTAPGIATLLIYIVAHVSCYDALHQLFMNIFFNLGYYRLAYLLSFIIGISLLRLTGSIWNWGTASLYEAVKFDLHNKLRLGDYDIKFIRWINKRKRLQQLLSIIGIYLCFLSVEFTLSELLLPTVCRVNNKVVEELPSQMHGIQTWLDSVLESNRFHPTHNTNRLSDSFEPRLDFSESDQDDQCKLSTNTLEEADSTYLYSKLSYSSYFSLYGWGEESKLISSSCQVLLSLTNAFISVTSLYIMGIGFWDD